ncbi:(2Fe-2S)-binding protein [Halorarum salinum]|uniref:(2Fe-2S)-binding protein n=1 Tax=Halorarum salinum TaxID=2743089 RepID=UPI001C52B018|nr:(2Fe-2S)-binding protein [Halobaculum salinum]
MSQTAVRDRVEVQVTVNDKELTRTIDPSTTLVELLREEFNLTGTTEGCGVGVCGCCTVYLDGKPVNSCLELAVNADGLAIETIEGLGDKNELDPVQEAFEEEEGFQCGYCTPGMIMMSKAMLDEVGDPDDETLQHYMSENLCRCTGYESIFDAIDTAAENLDID